MRRLGLPALLVLAIVAAACGDSAVTTTVPPTTSEAPATTAPQASAAPQTTVTTASATTNPPATAAPTTTATTTTTTLPPTTTTVVDDGVVAIDVSLSEGEVVGEDRYEVDGGADVRITVTADVADHVHVHGYDVFGDLAPDTAAVIELTADIPGIFEVELEDSGLLLFELVVGA